MFKKGNLIKKLIVTSIVILSTSNVIASESDNNNTMANNNQLVQSALPVQNNNLAGMGATLNVNKINKLLKPAGVDINECIKLFMTNPFMLKDKLTNAGCDMLKLEQLLNPTALCNYIAFGDHNLFELLKTSVIYDGIKSIMVSNEASMLVQAFIQNNDPLDKTSNLFKALFEKYDVTSELFFAYTKQNIKNVIDTCNKTNIIIPTENNKSLYYVTDALFNELNKTNDINDYVKKCYDLLASFMFNKAIAINNVYSNIDKIKSMKQKDKGKLKDYLLHNFKTLLAKNGNTLNCLKQEIKMIERCCESINNDQYFKANMNDSQIAEFNKVINLFTDIDKQQVQYLNGIQEVAEVVGITQSTLANTPAQVTNTQ